MTTVALSQLNTYDAGLMQAQAYRALSNFMVECLRPFELTMTEWAALGYICDNKEMRVTDLAIQLGVKVPRAIVLLAHLEREGYITKYSSIHDKRVVMIASTPAGKAQKDQIEPIMKENMRHFMLGVKPRDLVAYMRVLSFLAAKLYR